jgi:hypothetical protein
MCVGILKQKNAYMFVVLGKAKEFIREWVVKFSSDNKMYNTS